MASAGPGRLTLYKNHHPHKGSGSYHHVHPGGHRLHRTRGTSGKPPPVNSYGAGLEFDSQLWAYENMARHRYTLILDRLSLEKQPGWFDQMLNNHIFPTLNRIGFDEPISKGLFGIAPSAWFRMGPVNDQIIAFHPKINQEINDVRQGLKLKVGNNHYGFSRAPASGPSVISGTINKNFSPDHLFDLLDEIPTPWIILPRAFRFLQKHQCHYLPAYLATIDEETRESLLMLFSRITVEFVGNFSLKFASRCHQPDQIAKLLFYGYAALFWKTLRCPLENMENSAAFENFFNFMNRLVCNNAYLGNAEATFIHHANKMKNVAFPTVRLNPSGKPGRANSSRFLVTLRHGSRGMATILRYFGIDPFLETRQIRNRFKSPSFQNDLHSLLDTIQANYRLESKKTRGYIQQFIGCLQSAFALLAHDRHQSGWKFLIRKFGNIQMLQNR